MKVSHIASVTSIIFLVIISTALFTEQSMTPNHTTTPSQTSNPNNITLESTQLTVSQQHVTTEKSMTIHLLNDFNSSIFFGVEYDLYKMGSGNWTRFPSEPSWIAIGFSRSPGETYDQSIDVSGLITGLYRVSKEVDLGSNHKVVYADFTVDRPHDNPNGVPSFGYNPFVVALAEQSMESPNNPMVEIYNHGGLTLTLPSTYHIEENVNGQWVTVYSNDTRVAPYVLPPGGVYNEIWRYRFDKGQYRYIRVISAGGYVNPISFIWDFDWVN
jgi:hypothetical protein